MDGAGFTLQGSTVSKSSGIYLPQAYNVTIKRLSLKLFDVGIRLYYSSFTNITRTRLTSNFCGIRLESANYNTITCNNITSYSYGIYLSDSQSNLIFHNNLINNALNALGTWDPWCPSGNTWDNGYPSGGNYWSDYNGFDNNKGPSQNIPSQDGIGDTTLTVDTSNIDHYPLMTPCGTYHLTIEIDDSHGGTTNPPAGTYQFETGMEVEVTATPNSGFMLAYWRLGPDTLNDNPTKAVVDRNLILQAVFTPASTVPVVSFGIIGSLITMILVLVGFAGLIRSRQTRNA